MPLYPFVVRGRVHVGKHLRFVFLHHIEGTIGNYLYKVRVFFHTVGMHRIQVVYRFSEMFVFPMVGVGLPFGATYVESYYFRVPFNGTYVHVVWCYEK